MPKTAKIIIGIFLSFILLSTVGYFSLRYLVTKSFPNYDGELQISGVRQSVKIYRDQYGIPHIIAQSEHDALFAQGFVHAQDRLWQMDISRRAGEGRLSEILGTKTIKFDKMLRTIGFKKIAEGLEAQLHPESRDAIQAYCDGVNAFINSHRGKYPIEFDMLNYTPEEWKPIHSLMIARLMAWELNISWHVDVVLGELVAQLGEEKAKEIFPTYPENAPLIVDKKTASLNLKGLQEFVTLDRSRRELFGITGTHIGSNAWAVSPQKSVSGYAMLANDPHLGLGTPAKWYEVHLKGGILDVAGMSLPGTPLIVIGNNNFVAWGLTNVMADDADFFVEKTDSLQQKQYLFKGEWKDFEIEQDTIVVKDSAFVPFEIRRTIHGPVINSIYPISSLKQSSAITMKWTGFEMSDEMYAIYKINRSKNWESFLEGVKEFTVPGQNFVYADAFGNIGYKPGVRLPIRSNQNPTLPFAGWTGENEWKGFVPFEELPQLYNPPEGFIATANNKTTNNFPYHISNLWEPPSRIERIREVLSSKGKLSVNDFKKLQMDYFSQFAKDVTPFILAAYQSFAETDPRINTTVNYFRNWHFVETKDDVPTAIFEVFFQKLIRNIYKDEMGESLFRQYIVLANIPYRVTLALLHESSSVWFDDITTNNIETRDDIIKKSLKEAVDELQLNFGSEMKAWHWGKLHTMNFKHLFGDVKILQTIVNVGPFEVGGSGTTVNNGEFHFNRPYAMTLGPSMRKIVDFANINEALAVIPVGQSGQPLHKNYSDQTQLWLHGEYHPMPLAETAIQSITKNVQLLVTQDH